MKLTSKGIPKNINKQICKKAIIFYAQKLLSKRLKESLQIHIEFIELSENEFGYCNVEDDKNKSFLISINKDLTYEKTLIYIAHEMIHVKQYAKNELKDYVYNDKIRFRKEIFDKNRISYWQSPWEKEARKNEKKLYMSFIENKENSL